MSCTRDVARGISFIRYLECTFSAAAGVMINGVGGDGGIDGIEERRTIDEAVEARDRGVAGKRWAPRRGPGRGGAILRVTGGVGTESTSLATRDKG